jgi:hypothetical protein
MTWNLDLKHWMFFSMGCVCFIYTQYALSYLTMLVHLLQVPADVPLQSAW